MDESAIVPLSQMDEPMFETAEDGEEEDGEEEDGESYTCSDSDSLVSVDEQDDEDLNVEAIDDIPQHERVSKALEDYDLEDEIFSESDLQGWKEKEKRLVDRFKRGYYRCKQKNDAVYREICEIYKEYITEHYLQQLAHPYSTQHNEAMNHSVAAFAPKGKTFSKTESLDTRVAIAACIQILGYTEFWRQIFCELSITFDDNLRHFLEKMDMKKQKKRQSAETKDGKTKRSRKRNEKLKDEHSKDMTAQKEGVMYESGIAMRAATKSAKQQNTHTVRNPEGTPKARWRCKYWHQDFCQVLGHTSIVSKQCFMNGKTKQQREDAMNIIMDELIESEVQTKSTHGKYLVVQGWT